MADKELFVPLLPWLIGGSRIGGSYNTYIASVGTDPLTGCIGKKIFNYRIFIEKLEETEIIKACCYYGTTCFENQNEDDIITNTFEMGEEGLAEVKQWLEEKHSEFKAG